jgi:HSP20 family protein
MAVIRWKPLADIDKFLEDVHQHFNRDLAADIYDENGAIVIEMNVAGINPDKVDIVVEGDHVKITGLREEKSETKDRNYYSKEIRRGSFERILHLPAEVEKEKTRAEVTDGVLKIYLPKRTQSQSHKVKVEKH